MNSNCVGSLAFLTGPTFDFFVSQKSELQMIQTNPNTVFQGVAERVSDRVEKPPSALRPSEAVPITETALHPGSRANLD